MSSNSNLSERPAEPVVERQSSPEMLIRIENVSKLYRIWNDPKSRLQHPLLNAAGAMFPFSRFGLRNPKHKARELYREFFALRNVSFEVKKGESIGIIGRNGAGKSTLLQLIVGTLQPTTGKVEVRGRVAALLELGSGFNPEFTGRENVYLNASILGFSRQETETKFEQIEAFAEIGSFLDQPVKTYSSGMMVRLAFAVQVAVEPDLLIIDEALSVGDIFFQQKCFSRIREMQEKGTSLLFVSHDISAVHNLCDRSILLSGGEKIYDGPPEEASSRYFALSGKGIGENSSLIDRSPTPAVSSPDSLMKNLILKNNILPMARARHGKQMLEIAAASFGKQNGTQNFTVEMNHHAIIHLILRAHQSISLPTVGIHLFDRMNNLVFASGSDQLGVFFPAMQKGEELMVSLQVELSVQPGLYTFSLESGEPSDTEPNGGLIHDCHEGLGPINVWADQNEIMPFYGIARLDMTIQHYDSQNHAA